MIWQIEAEYNLLAANGKQENEIIIPYIYVEKQEVAIRFL